MVICRRHRPDRTAPCCRCTVVSCGIHFDPSIQSDSQFWIRSKNQNGLENRITTWEWVGKLNSVGKLMGLFLHSASSVRQHPGLEASGGAESQPGSWPPSEKTGEAWREVAWNMDCRLWDTPICTNTGYSDTIVCVSLVTEFWLGAWEQG